MGFDEVLTAVIPSDSSAQLREGLEQAGVPMLEYEAGNESDRLAKVNSVENAKFSRSNKAALDGLYTYLAPHWLTRSHQAGSPYTREVLARCAWKPAADGALTMAAPLTKKSRAASSAAPFQAHFFFFFFRACASARVAALLAIFFRYSSYRGT